MDEIRINTTAVGTDQLDDLAKVIGRIAVESFNDPDIRKQYEEWKKCTQPKGDGDCMHSLRTSPLYAKKEK
ncbi:MAG: hypothetical protein K6F23_15965 [Solobacterium sp.]|nr:hypothetical protein [Solobacterium sp.]